MEILNNPDYDIVILLLFNSEKKFGDIGLLLMVSEDIR